jgi:hypothetical protein
MRKLELLNVFYLLDLADEGNPISTEAVRDTIREAGGEMKVTWDYETACYEPVWVHRVINNSNRNILDTWFCHLYELKDGIEPIEGHRPPFKFCIGRIGNATMFDITGIEEDPIVEVINEQLDLFEERV